MTIVPIPAWNAMGLIPPLGSVDPTAAERSPYAVSLSEVVLRFGTSTDRRRILDGFLRYRARLHAAGLASGFQWLDGSFLEDIEVIEGRSPNDLDVVTFFHLPTGISQAQMQACAPDAFPLTRAERVAFKGVFFVDPYFVHLGAPSERLVGASTYWYSLWSHRRDGAWKGYLRVDLRPTEDATAAHYLSAAPAAEGTP